MNRKLTEDQHQTFADMVDEKGLHWTATFAAKHLGVEEAAELAAGYLTETGDATHTFLVGQLDSLSTESLVGLFGTGRVGAAMFAAGWNVSVPNLEFL